MAENGVDIKWMKVIYTGLNASTKLPLPLCYIEICTT